MTNAERPPRAADRPEGNPPAEETVTEETSGRTPRPTDPAEGTAASGDGADTPG